MNQGRRATGQPRVARSRSLRIAGSLVCAAGILCAGLLWTEMRRRHGLYAYDVTASYRFDFAGEDVQRLPVRVGSSGFAFPDWHAPWQTALLRLTVDSSWTSAWFEPVIGLDTHGRTPCRQYFERQAGGLRYLNLCLDSTTATPGAFIEMVGEHVTWPDQDAELLLFSSPLTETAKLLVLAPHSDDAEIAAFGLYARRDAWVVTVTNGSYGGERYRQLVPDPVERDRLQAALRVADSISTPIWAGLDLDRGINLGYFTLALERMYQDPQRVVPNRVSGSVDVGRWRRSQLPALTRRPAASTWENLVGDLAVLVTEVSPDIVVLPHPALDANRDHVFTAAAFLEAMDRLGDPALQLLLYTNHHTLSEYYPFGPADAVVTLPPWFDQSLPVRSILSHPLDRDRQVEKLFALDAMHDLRPPPEPVLGGTTHQILKRLTDALGEVARDPARELSYFRRAIRPNEIFFAYTSADRHRLQQLIPSRTAASANYRVGPPIGAAAAQ